MADKEVIWTSDGLKEALNVEVFAGIQGQSIQFNSQSVRNEDIFIALKGNRDGHMFVENAFQNGASAAIVSKNVENVPQSKLIIVPDTYEALKQLAKYKRSNSKAIFIAITGAVGKTSTKEALKQMLSRFAPTFATRLNFNNTLGINLNLASMPNNIKYSVIEIGLKRTLESFMENVSLVDPKMVIITKMSESHLEFQKTMENYVNNKCKIFSHLNENGVVIFNEDHEWHTIIRKNLQTTPMKAYTFGESKTANCQLVSYEWLREKVQLKYCISHRKDESIQINIKRCPIPKHFCVNYAGCLMAVQALGLDVNEVEKELENMQLVNGRGNVETCVFRNKTIQIICDHYNNSPEALKMSLEHLGKLKNLNKSIIFGEYKELGPTLLSALNELPQYLIKSGVKNVYFIGSHSKCVFAGLPDNIRKLEFSSTEELLENFDEIQLTENEVFLVKGGRGMYLEKVLSKFGAPVQSFH